jgi:hypothetical protein
MKDPAPITMLAALLATIGRNEAPNTYVKHARDAEALAAIGRKAERLAVRQCNEPMTNAQEARAEKNRAKWGAEAAEILTPYGVDPESITTHGDPRGYCLKWAFPADTRGHRPSNSFGGDIWGV